MAERVPSPDRLRLTIPSDQVSRDAVLAANPRLHPAYAGRSIDLPEKDLSGSLYLAMRANESALIAKTFDRALGRPDPYPNSSREALIAALAEDYRFFGVSSGRKHAEQLLRSLEKAVTAQAEELLGEGRS